MTVWVRETRDGVETGNNVGFAHRIEAGAWVEKMRHAKGMDPAYAHYRHLNIDWKIS